MSLLDTFNKTKGIQAPQHPNYPYSALYGAKNGYQRQLSAGRGYKSDKAPTVVADGYKETKINVL